MAGNVNEIYSVCVYILIRPKRIFSLVHAHIYTFTHSLTHTYMHRQQIFFSTYRIELSSLEMNEITPLSSCDMNTSGMQCIYI